MFFRYQYFHDNEGNSIKGPNDIVVTNITNLETGTYYEVNSDLYGSGMHLGRLYSNYVNRQTKEVFDIICSKATKEVIPFDCLDKPTYTILLCGRPDVGKTTYVIQALDKCPDMISAGSDISVCSALDGAKLPKDIQKNLQRYRNQLKPLPTGRTIKDGCESILFYIDNNGETAAVKVIDVPGENTLDGASRFMDHSDCIFLFLDLSEPVTAQDNIYKYLQEDRIKELKNTKSISNNIPVYVILTKADKLIFMKKGVRINLSKEIPYSTEMNDFDKLQLTAEYHTKAGGYDFDFYRDAEEKIIEYISNVHPGIYQLMKRAFGNNLRFFLLGNYMKEVPTEVIPKDISLYRVELPMLHFLAENNLYPCKNQYQRVGSAHDMSSEETVQGQGKGRFSAIPGKLSINVSHIKDVLIS